MSETAAIYETKYGYYLVLAFYSDGTFCDSATARNMAKALDLAKAIKPTGGRSVVMRAVSVVTSDAELLA